MSGIKVGFVMLGKFAITGAYSTIYLYSAEMFPTCVRYEHRGKHLNNISKIIEIRLKQVSLLKSQWCAYHQML